MPILDHFGLIAPFYDRLISFQRGDKLIELLGLPVQGSLLDAGGGTGRVAQAFVGQVSEVVVADISTGMLKQAGQKEGVVPVNTLTETLPFATGSFHRIVMVDAMHHVIDHARTASELWRVLSPGGRIVIEEPDIQTAPVKMIALFEKLALMRSHFISPVSIARLFPAVLAETRIERDGYNAWIIINKR